MPASAVQALIQELACVGRALSFPSFAASLVGPAAAFARKGQLRAVPLDMPSLLTLKALL